MTDSFSSRIPDIAINRVYDQIDPDADIHYETFGKLAEFFGRNSSMHRHSSCYQVHVLVSGTIHLNLDGRVYVAQAPLIIFTPPSTPHSFYTDMDAEGHVLTIRQHIVRQWLGGQLGAERLLPCPQCIELSRLDSDVQASIEPLYSLLVALSLEKQRVAYDTMSLRLSDRLTEAVFMYLYRALSASHETVHASASSQDEIILFLLFLDLIEDHFLKHASLSLYTDHLGVSESRLHEVCKQLSQQSPKELVHDRLMQEARRLLRFTSMPIVDVSAQLGFKDPAYFSRFFTKRQKQSPSHYRQHCESRS